MKRLLMMSLFVGFCATAMDAQGLPYQNANLSAAQRADDLLSRLTLDEKVSLMMDTSPAIPRLGIPQFQWWNEALHGIGRNGFATVFPITMAMAASWDDALLHQVFTAVSDEARVKAQQAKRTGNIKRYQSLSFWTPNINIFRDPRWGRGQETYGEDPYLTAKMGLAVVRGLQGVGYNGEDLGVSKYRKLLACAKHFAVHSGPEWNRHEFNIENPFSGNSLNSVEIEKNDYILDNFDEYRNKTLNLIWKYFNPKDIQINYNYFYNLILMMNYFDKADIFKCDINDEYVFNVMQGNIKPKDEEFEKEENNKFDNLELMKQIDIIYGSKFLEQLVINNNEENKNGNNEENVNNKESDDGEIILDLPSSINTDEK